MEFVPKSKTILVFFVNGVKIEDQDVNPEWTLLQYLREKLRLPATKMGCAEGGCGACTVMVSQINRQTGKVRHITTNACLAPVCAMHGLAVTTAEGIGSTETRLHPVQERLAKSHGSQCGFCTPGFVMSMYTLLRNNPRPTMEEIEENLVGNLCRCTGYRPILEGFRTFTEEQVSLNGCGKSDCCQLKNEKHTREVNGTHFQNGNHTNEVNGIVNGSESDDSLPSGGEEGLRRTCVRLPSSTLKPLDPTQEIIFPPELKMNSSLDEQFLIFRGPRTTFYRPVTLDQLLDLKQNFPEAVIVTGNTEVGIEVKFKNMLYPLLICPMAVPELMVVEVTDSWVEIGAAVPLSSVELKLKELIKELPAHKTRIIASILEMLKWFAGRQIRNVASLGGNIMTGSPISDLNPILMAAGATLVFKSVDSEREIEFDDSFYIGYRKNIAKPTEVLQSVKIPFSKEDEYFQAFKQSRRRDDDIAIVNSAMRVVFEPRSFKVSSVVLAFGGMAPTTIFARKTMEKLEGRDWNNSLLETATTSLLNELQLHPSAPGGMTEYRTALTPSFFFKFFLSVRNELHKKHSYMVPPLKADDKEIIKPFCNAPVRSAQFFQNVPEGQPIIDPIGRPIPHVSSLEQTCGKATYADDIPRFENEFHAALVLSTRPYAKILKIDESKALQMNGVERFFCARDLPGDQNETGCLEHDEEIFASKVVPCVGSVVGIVVASNQQQAQEAARAVEITYEDLPNPIFTIKDAIKAGTVWDPLQIESGNIDDGFKQSDHVIEGEVRMGGQEHFYIETNVHIAIPKEKNELEVICSTQSPTETQALISKALKIPANRINVSVRRLGGGFGGKQSRSTLIAIPVALAASRTKRPVRIVLDRDEDMMVTAGRHPFLGRWKVGFNKDGSLNALDVDLYSNAGHSLDLSNCVMMKAMFNINNTYRIKNLKVRGQSCRTNLPSNTAFRAFGNPQGAFVMENIIEQVANFLQVDSRKVREKNLYTQDIERTHFGQDITQNTVQQCWKQVLASGKIEERSRRIKEFNSRNTYIKRGLSVTPIKFGIGFELPFLNQAGALVLVYVDGSVLISHGGVEMGQGVHTKMIQVASRVLGVPMETIYISQTDVNRVPNTSPSAASVTSDLNGMAIIDACQKINKRLKPFKGKNPQGSWKDWVSAAYFDGVSLFDTGFYRTPDIKEFNFKDYSSEPYSFPFNYYCFGAGATEVEIDCLTGDHKVLRADIVMDLGNSLNPAIDIGQIEGAFVQGMGLFTLEQLVYSPEGSLLTKGPGAYKLPSIQDIPREFNVSLLRGFENPRAIYSSKAVGEPPLLTSMSVFFAIKEAVKATKGDFVEKDFKFDSPATAERIRMACKDWITNQMTAPRKDLKKPWSIDILE